MELETALLAPESWTRLTIASICVRFTSGGTPSRQRPEYYVNGTIPWVKTQELSDWVLYDTEERITPDALAASSAKLLPPNTVLMAMYGATVGQLGILGREMACNQACAAMVIDPSIADYRFVFYQLLANRRQIKSLATGAAQQNLSGSQVKEFVLAFPSLPEQKAIADFLWTIDCRRALLRETNLTLESVAEAIFKSWFVDFEPVHAKAAGRDPKGMDAETAALFPSEFEDSELGPIPKGWRVDCIGNVLDTVSGTTPRTRNPAFWEPGEYFWATPKDLSALSSPVLLETERRISQSGLECIGSGLLPKGSLLLSSRAPIGYLAITEIETAINQGFIGMLPGGQLPPLFMLFWCRLNMHTIFQHANGSTFLEISRSSFRRIRLVVPPSHVVAKFVEIAGLLLQKITNNERQRKTLTEIRDTVLPRLISGKLGLPDGEALLQEAV